MTCHCITISPVLLCEHDTNGKSTEMPLEHAQQILISTRRVQFAFRCIFTSTGLFFIVASNSITTYRVMPRTNGDEQTAELLQM